MAMGSLATTIRISPSVQLGGIGVWGEVGQDDEERWRWVEREEKVYGEFGEIWMTEDPVGLAMKEGREKRQALERSSRIKAEAV